MKMNVELFPETEIAYLRRIGPYGLGNIRTMEKLKTWAQENGLLNCESIILGIPWDNPEIANPPDCRYDACLVITNGQGLVDDEVNRGKLSPGEYAVFEIEHTTEALEKAWLELFAELNNHGYQFDDTKPIIERYAAKMVAEHHCEICVPIR